MPELLDIGIELGGTKIVVAASPGGRDLTGRIRISTEQPQSTLAAVRSAIDDLAGSASVAAIGIGSFGPLDLRRESPAYGTIVRTPKPNWSGVDVVSGIVASRDVPVAVDTDVAAALRAEHRWGAATTPTAAYATVGTGLGVALWSHGRIVDGMNHSEIGHIRVPRHHSRRPSQACLPLSRRLSRGDGVRASYRCSMGCAGTSPAAGNLCSGAGTRGVVPRPWRRRNGGCGPRGNRGPGWGSSAHGRSPRSGG